MSGLRGARDLPVARARLLKLLTGPTPATWSGIDYPPHLDPDPIGYARWMADWVAGAPLIWVDPDMTELARNAGAGLPEMSISPELPPRSSGLLVWQTPLTPRWRPTIGVTFTCVGVAWTVTDWGLWLDFLDTADTSRATPTVAAAMSGGPLLPWQGVALPWHPRVALGQAWGTDRPELAEAVLTTVATMLLATQDNIATGTVQRATPRDRRWLTRHDQPPTAGEVTVVSLRARQRDPRNPATSGTGGGTRTHRWLVSGHWRNQPYGPRNTLRRPTWIAPHIAGPDGAPFTERVNLLTRPTQPDPGGTP
jgi:hypothetical protein